MPAAAMAQFLALLCAHLLADEWCAKTNSAGAKVAAPPSRCAHVQPGGRTLHAP